MRSCVERILVSGYEREGLVVRLGDREFIGTMSGTRIQIPGEVPVIIMSFRDESAFVRLQQRLLQNISSTAEDRYRAFVEIYPHLATRLPQVQIAAFLGVSPEFLSRLRNRSARKPKSTPKT